MQLKKVLQNLTYSCIAGYLSQEQMEEEISDVIYDSRKLIKGCIFVCIVGAKMDSHMFLEEAIEKGASVVVIQDSSLQPQKLLEKLGKQTAILLVENTRKTLAELSAAYFGYPLREMISIGVTGTKGKTTTAYMIKELLKHAGHTVGMIGTIGAFYGDTKIETNNTTPESYELHKIFHTMKEEGVTHVVMEVSSQAYLTHRVEGITFDYGIFTNLSPDHIGEGEHTDFEDYLRCKSMLFKNCREGIVNQDDPHVKEILSNHTCEIHTFGIQGDLRISDVICLKEADFIGIQFQTEGLYNMSVKVGCMGRFNAYNALAAMSLAALLQISADVVKEVMIGIAVRGRVEPVKISSKFHYIIDYAHNAVSAESLLTTMLEYQPKRLVCVFGAGGNRSKLRRYDMGEIAGRYADFSIITSDNPRFEEPEDIILDILIGMKKTKGKYITIVNRKEAIKYSLEHAREGDLIVLFGKGHEDYQEIKGKRYPFDERVVIQEVNEELRSKL